LLVPRATETIDLSAWKVVIDAGNAMRTRGDEGSADEMSRQKHV
jgi:hypothetical protein